MDEACDGYYPVVTGRTDMLDMEVIDMIIKHFVAAATGTSFSRSMIVAGSIHQGGSYLPYRPTHRLCD